MTQVRVTSSSARKKPKSAISKSQSKTNQTISDDERMRLIREEAYFRAERRGFADGNPEQDWFEAEAEIEKRYKTSE